MSTTQLQLRRGNSSQVAVFCGAEGELVYDTTNKHLRVHDGHKNAQDEYDHTGMIIPNRDEVVRKTGSAAETISGVKTFNSDSKFNSAITSVNTAHALFDGTDSSKYFYFDDNGGRHIGWIEGRLDDGDSGNTRLRLWARTYTNNTYTTSVDSVIDICAKPDGTKYATAPKPANDTTTNNARIVTTDWVNDSTSGVNNLVHKSGTETIGGTKTFSSKIYANGGVQGTASSALWADLAEQYQSDKEYPAGTLISFGGEKDITIAKVECHGVISDKPGFLLDCGLENSLPVALVGKTPVRVIGKIKKFDRIVLSDIPGVGKEQTTSDEKVVAIALENNDSEEEKLVMAVVKVSF